MHNLGRPLPHVWPGKCSILLRCRSCEWMMQQPRRYTHVTFCRPNSLRQDSPYGMLLLQKTPTQIQLTSELYPPCSPFRSYLVLFHEVFKPQDLFHARFMNPYTRGENAIHKVLDQTPYSLKSQPETKPSNKFRSPTVVLSAAAFRCSTNTQDKPAPAKKRSLIEPI